MPERTPGPGERSTAHRPGGVLDDWADRVAEALSVPDAPVDVPLLLDVARDVAHAVDRPAVPITMFLLGYAAARGDGSADAVAVACAHTGRLAHEWAADAGKPQDG